MIAHLSTRFLLTAIAAVGFTCTADAAIIDFNGGTATLSDGTSVTVTDTGPVYSNVDFYVEDGIMIDFIGGVGYIGDYYGGFFRPDGSALDNSVIHAHWDGAAETGLTAIRFTKVDGSTLDLNYVDLTSNTQVGGGAATGGEMSYITPFGGGSPMLLPSSDWGIEFLSTGAPGDGIERLYLSSAFDGILGFDVTSLNAFCFGLDNFYIDEEPPPPPPTNVPEPSTLMLLLAGFGLLGVHRAYHRT